MSAGTAGSCCRSPDIQATACRGGKIGWSQFSLRRSRSDSSRLGSPSTVQPRCWTHSRCSRAVRSIGAGRGIQTHLRGTIFFGTDMQRERAAVVHRARFNFMSEARIWYSRDADQATLPGGLQNEIILSHEFFSEIMSHPIPTDMEAAKALSCSPAALDLFMWLSY